MPKRTPLDAKLLRSKKKTSCPLTAGQIRPRHKVHFQGQRFDVLFERTLLIRQLHLGTLQVDVIYIYTYIYILGMAPSQ